MSAPVVVSLYNVGFGDCFLIRFPASQDLPERKVLIDCGTIKRGAAMEMGSLVKRIIEDIGGDGANVDVVAMTHRHKDHVSGFSSSDWASVAVKEVWMPWTENPDDPVAREVLDKMAGFALALNREFELIGATGVMSAEELELVTHVLENSLFPLDDTAFSLSNESAMATLHRGFEVGAGAAKRLFLSREEPLDTQVLPGVRVHVLGPSTDQDVIGEMNPPSSESFLRANSDHMVFDSPEDLLPFSVAEEYDIDHKIVELLDRVAGESAILGAVALEQAVNNTSLMLVFEVGEAVLFFPGDSQWGSWRMSLEDSTSRDLLRRTRFYKVGHHGSHNSSPKTFVQEVLGNGFWAAASVTPHGRFTSIPKRELLEALRAKTDPGKVVRSDEPPVAPMPDGVEVVIDDGELLRIDFTIPTD
jgi:beta-lactamase superfamily II metal-dependent hydrolase